MLTKGSTVLTPVPDNKARGNKNRFLNDSKKKGDKYRYNLWSWMIVSSIRFTSI